MSPLRRLQDGPRRGPTCRLTTHKTHFLLKFTRQPAVLGAELTCLAFAWTVWGGVRVEVHDADKSGGFGPNSLVSNQLEGFSFTIPKRGNLCRNDGNHRPEARVGNPRPTRGKRTQRDGQAMVVFLRSSQQEYACCHEH